MVGAEDAAGNRVRQLKTVAVTVVIPCHNAAEFLADALHSVQGQTLGDFECLIIDDASTDNSAAIAERFVNVDSRFKLLSLKENQGASAARNAGLSQAVGQWITLLDADDLYLPERLQLLTSIGDSESADIVFDDQIMTNFPCTTSAHRSFGFTQSKFTVTQEDFFAGSRLFRRSLAMGYMQPLIRREFLLRNQGTFDPAVLSGEDFLLYAHLFAAHPLCVGTSFAGYVYRRRRGSLSRSDTHLHFHAQLGDRVLKELGPQLSSGSRAALAGRRRDFEELSLALPSLSALREKDWLRLVRSLIAQPRALITCLRLGKMWLVRSWSALIRTAPRASVKGRGDR